MLFTLEIVLLAILAGSMVFCILTAAAAWHYLRTAPASPGRGKEAVPLSVLKPLAGVDEGLVDNLRSFFEQDYPEFEILAAVRDAGDPAFAAFSQLQAEHPGVPSRLIITGEPPYPNAKVYSLDHMLRAARHDLLVMSDSDIRVDNGFLRGVAAEFTEPDVGLATCPYRASGRSLWSKLEAIGMNTEFLAGVLVARMLEGMKFAVGPTIVARRQVLESIGGFARLKDYLAEDFVMGRLAGEAGYRVILSCMLIEHRLGGQEFRRNMAHRLRWARSTRRSRPAGYLGQVFTNLLPFALALIVVQPGWWQVSVAAIALRALAAWAVAGWVLHDRLTAHYWYLVPVQDLLSFIFWVAGFFGNTIAWRGRRYHLSPDGRFELIQR
jgi:ceramide glucosyltransferase